MKRQIKLEQEVPNGDYYVDHSTIEFGRSLSRSSDHSSTIGHSQKLSFDNKVCRVCGDKALSINFNVITCESCKAFFRRNALKPKEFRCPFNNECEITMASRKFCKKCRLRKCFDVGMMKEWIMTEEARLQKRQLIENNREKRHRLFPIAAPPVKIRRKNLEIQLYDSPPATSSSFSSDEQQADTPNFYNGNSISTTPTNASTTIMTDWLSSGGRRTSGDTILSTNDVADSITIPKSVLLNLINRCQQNSQHACPRCPPPPILARALSLYESGGLDGVDWSTTSDEQTSKILKCICSCACGARPPSTTENENKEKDITDSTFSQMDVNENADFPISNFANNTLSYSEVAPSLAYTSATQSMQELLMSRRAFEGMAAELGFGIVNPQQQQHMRYVISDPVDCVRMTHACMTRIIEMNKMLSPFRNLTSADQVALLKGGMRELMMIQSAINYNHEIDAWLPFGRNQPYVMRLDMLQKLKADLVDQHVSFIRSFAPQWSYDEVLMQNLAAICLFDPSRPGIVDTAAILRKQQYYCGLMKDYLFTIYGHGEGLRIFNELQNRLNWLRRSVDRMQPTFHLELSQQDLTPLMFELLL